MEKISKNKIKFLRSLRLKKNRDKERVFLVEGEKMVLEALQLSRQIVREVYIEKGQNIQEIENFDAVFELTSLDASKISGFKTPNKCLALLEYPTVEITNKDFTLVLDQIQDPGNLGTIIRLADWFGVDDIVCSTRTTDCFNPKVIQASMGSILRTKISYFDLETYLKSEKRPVFGALLDGENVYQSKLPKSAILIMGNEGNGISPEIEKMVEQKILIPKFGHAESLNVATATGILLSEFFRG